jgi:nitroimidazol reductase NimA-like FMN-containing flavoprotein (pyridoxamine 5'-phosphate oxidase superfamily)/ribosomal protein S18 acetylase RimI-like enzyme
MDQRERTIGRMRREIFRGADADARALLARAPYVHLASTTADGAPLLRVVHGVLVDGALCFHAARAGEKVEALGRPAVAAYEEVVAEIPSTFTDAERACPATTLYESVHVKGVLREIEDVGAKARVLAALMARFQPEGGHAPIDPAHPRYEELYARAVRGLLVVGLSLDVVDGKRKLGQNKQPAEVARILDGLWRRGRDGDVRAIELVRAACGSAGDAAFLRGPAGTTLHVAWDERFAPRAAELLTGAYWNVGVPADVVVQAQRGSTAWVGATIDGRLIGCARAIADGAKWAWIYDVAVDEALRGRGIGRALVRLLLDHPRVRGCRGVALRTRDAQGVYAPLGFVPSEATLAGVAATTMLLRR